MKFYTMLDLADIAWVVLVAEDGEVVEKMTQNEFNSLSEVLQ